MMRGDHILFTVAGALIAELIALRSTQQSFDRLVMLVASSHSDSSPYRSGTAVESRRSTLR
jgi:hypothetical protein